MTAIDTTASELTANAGIEVSEHHREILQKMTASGAIPPSAERIAQKVASTPNTTSDLAWRSTASCCDTDPDLFFPIGTTGIALEQVAEAKTVCNSCPAQLACLEFALRTNQDTGIWGGTSEEERRQLRRTYLGRRRRTAI